MDDERMEEHCPGQSNEVHLIEPEWDLGGEG